MSVEQETEVVETEEETTSLVPEPSADEREKRAGEFFDKLMNKPTEAEAKVDADDEPAEESDQEQEPEKEPEQVKVEGPSVAAKLWAKQSGLDPELISLAPNDEALEKLVEKFATSREVEPKPEPQAPETFKLDLPEDEFPADDPVRKQLTALNDFYAKRLEQAQSDAQLIAQHVIDLEKFVEQFQGERTNNVIRTFDDKLDSLNSDVLGSGDKRNSRVRAAVWDTLQDLKEERKGVSEEELLREALETFGIKSQDQKRIDAIRQSNKTRLGGGPSKAIPPREPTREDKFNQLMDRLEAKNK